jgi:hypothetical protein
MWVFACFCGKTMICYVSGWWSLSCSRNLLQMVGIKIHLVIHHWGDVFLGLWDRILCK